MDIATLVIVSCAVGNLGYAFFSKRFNSKRAPLSYSEALRISLFQIFAVWVTAFILTARYEKLRQPITGTRTEISETGILTFHFQKQEEKIITCDGHRGGVDDTTVCDNPGELR